MDLVKVEHGSATVLILPQDAELLAEACHRAEDAFGSNEAAPRLDYLLAVEAFLRAVAIACHAQNCMSQEALRELRTLVMPE